MPTLAADAEVVVVDNAPGTSGTRQIVERFPRVRIIDEPRPGLSIARNTGIAATAGEIIAFTDDDVVVHPRWLERLRAAFADPATMCVTGLVLPAELETEAQTVFELGLGGFGQGYQPRSFDSAWLRSGRRGCPPVWKLGAGANMALRRSALARVGGFDERLGAGAAGCSEDSELWYRLLAAGQLCRYVPDVVVFHHHRREWSSLRAQMYAYMRGHVAALLVQFGYGRDPRHLTRIGVQLPMFYIRELLRGWQGRSPLDRHRLLTDQVRGSIAGLAALRRSAPPASRHAA
jgi:GT2 family glycosyltransferase